MLQYRNVDALWSYRPISHVDKSYWESFSKNKRSSALRVRLV